MKFLFVIKSFAQIAGVERVMSDKMNYLASSGHNIILLTYEQGSHPLVYTLHQNIKHVDLDCRFFTLSAMSPIKRLFKSFIMNRRFKKRIRSIIKDFNPDTIISPTYPLSVIGNLVSAKENSRLIFESHMTYNKALKEYSKPRFYIEKIVAKIFDKRAISLFQKCDCFAVLTKGDYSFWGKYISNIKIIPNPLTSYPKELSNLPKDHNRIISIGRLTSVKRFDRLIDSFALICNHNPFWHIDIFGEGSDRNNLLERISQLGISDRVCIHQPTNDIYAEIQKSQLLAMTSESEGFALVLIEAMACGVPCISFNCPYGPGEIIEHDKNGLLIENGNIQEFANKLEYLMSNPNLVEEMGIYARKSAEQYRKEIIMKSWEKLYLGNHI